MSKHRSDAAFAAATMLTLLAAAPALAHPLDLAAQPPPAATYFALGVEHIVTGIDHLLFLLGLVVVAARLRDVLWAVTAFTLAHSVTLVLAALGLVTPDPAWVEPLIALSIAYVGLENLFARAHSARIRLAFGFGLLHGLGFAGALAEVGLPSDQRLLALVLFNTGVEAGQIALLAVLMPVLWRLRRFEPARRFGMPALSASLVVIGLTWAGGRLPELGGDGGVAQARNDQDARAAATSRGASPESSQSDLPRSTYPLTDRGAIDPRVEQLCAAFHELPRARRAACGGRASAVMLDAECKRILNGAVQSGGLVLDAQVAQQCLAETRARYADCSFTAQRALPAVPACTQIWRGARAQGERCRSSLECGHGQHCRGAGPLDTGVCEAAKAEGATCGTAVDPLAAYVPDAERDHAECTGQCVNGRCRARVGSGKGTDRTRGTRS
jgi:hydrogenase/urease accessory protein HupE